MLDFLGLAFASFFEVSNLKYVNSVANMDTILVFLLNTYIFTIVYQMLELPSCNVSQLFSIFSRGDTIHGVWSTRSCCRARSQDAFSNHPGMFCSLIMYKTRPRGHT